MSLCPLLLTLTAAGQTVVIVDRDDVVIRESCQVRVGAPFIVDANGDGVVQIVGEDIAVEFVGPALHGAAPDVRPDRFGGCGVRVTGRDVTVRGLRASGYKVALHATDAHGMLLEDIDVSGNFRQRLRSTPEAEAGEDWLWPHANDDNEWLTRYGAGLYIEDSTRVTVRRVRARDGQNGIVLDRVDDSRIYDNDCSFLSGWGLAMWRSSRNLVSRNAFDFCIRGYSHGVYNRGQDSAGILAFEQCSDNVFAQNSATHGGDGFFAFAGNEALGETNPRDDATWYERRGHRGNVIFGNDFSYAAAHGIELTFSFDNEITSNRLVGNAICGIWGGYSQDTTILGNTIEDNGDMGYGLERGGVNIEHGHDNRIEHNRFAGNACGVHLWWDEDEHLMRLPWARVNERGSSDSSIRFCRFRGDELAIHLRRTTGTRIMGIETIDVGARLDVDDASDVVWEPWDGPIPEIALQPPPAAGRTNPVGARRELRGREHIVMTEWGPYDWQSPLLQRTADAGARHDYRLLGPTTVSTATLETTGPAELRREDERLIVRTEQNERAVPYVLTVTTDETTCVAKGLLLPLRWTVRVFRWETDPRVDVEAWRAEADKNGVVGVTRGALRLAYGSRGPSDLELGDAVAAAELPADRFGTLAETRVTLPAGRYRLRTRSDDGIRVWVDDEVVIDDWTWHAPREHAYELQLTAPRTIRLRAEHFELDGAAVLSVDVEVTEEE